MNGPHDMGGMMGFGPIAPEPNEPPFHAPWQRRALGLTLAVGATGSWTIDQSRHEREKLSPQFYWTASYYEIWLAGLTKLLRDRGMVTARDIWAKCVVDAPLPVKRVLRKQDVASVLAKGSPYDRPAATRARFSTGDSVHTRNFVTPHHTRLPSYARNRTGVIIAIRGHHVLPDASARGESTAAWLYTVQFTVHELWGRNSKDSVCLDLWEPYLENAP